MRFLREGRFPASLYPQPELTFISALLLERFHLGNRSVPRIILPN